MAGGCVLARAMLRHQAEDSDSKKRRQGEIKNNRNNVSSDHRS
jgi:hypothetical protein